MATIAITYIDIPTMKKSRKQCCLRPFRSDPLEITIGELKLLINNTLILLTKKLAKHFYNLTLTVLPCLIELAIILCISGSILGAFQPHLSTYHAQQRAYLCGQYIFRNYFT